MLLRRLEAYGFKSFAEKTQLEFGPGVTAIVGPNGSGKSNISDAIRWALGEQSLRTLRGAKMEDVIFAGSVNRRPLGVAEVSLVFDNSDGQLPLDFNEVTITRRVFRSGDSEYYINKTSCRLKDIHDLLTDTGLGRESMTVIGQNKVDEILSSKPEDRRLLFEEAAGITKYKQRKRESLRKLEDTEQNLTRVQDINAELESQLEPLAESAERTARYNELSAELIACQATLLLERLSKAEKMIESATLEQTALTDQSIAISTRLVVAENEKEQLIVSLAQVDEQVAGLDTASHNAATELERIDGKRAVLIERLEQGKRAGERLADDVVRLEGDIDLANEQLFILHKKLELKQEQVAQIDVLVAEKNKCHDKLLDSIRRIEQQIEVGKDTTFEHMQQLVNERNNLRMTERDLLVIDARRVSLEKEQTDYARQQSENMQKKNQLTQESVQLSDRSNEVETRTTSLLTDKSRLEQTQASLTNREQKLAGNISETSSRLKVLTSMQHELEGFGRAIKGILKSGADWRNGICGAVAQLITVPDKYVTAIEIALGGAQQHVVADNDQTAKQAIAFLKAQNLGRATFLPLNTIKIAKPRDSELLAANQLGALGFATAFVTAADRYRPVIDYLLGRVIVAENIDDALKIAKTTGFSVKIVTLDGEIINPGGSLAGGSIGRKETSFIARNNEIKSLGDVVGELKEQLLVVKKQIVDTATELMTVGRSETELGVVRQEIELRKAELAVHLDKIRLDGERFDVALKTIAVEIMSCQQTVRQCDVKIKQSQTNITLLENQDIEHKSQIINWQNEHKVLKAEQQTVSDELTEAKIRLSVINQELSAARSACQQQEQNGLSHTVQLKRLKAEQDQLILQSKQAQSELTTLSDEWEKLSAEKNNYQRQREASYTVKLELLATNQKLDKELRDLRRCKTDLQSRTHENELLAAKYSYEVGHCRDQITVQLSLSLAEAQQLRRDDSPEQLTLQISGMESSIAALGPVNPAAIEEFAKVKERHSFLLEQTRDLAKAKDYLTAVIKEIDNTMSRQFTSAFQAISQYFSEVFVRLFGGGRAELVLAEPGNVLETGIEIIVQPPGKKLQNLVMLSGGERALAVIALLFAILTYRPAPFCVVDEIDAALDEANVQRFSEFLQDYARTTQFIVVTHRKGTMEAAHVLHGVTMEESGISRLVSVKFMDKAG